MMDRSQQELRHAAAREFMESLDQLQETLISDNQPIQYQQGGRTEPDPSPDNFDLRSFEQAIADIEQFIQHKQDNG